MIHRLLFQISIKCSMRVGLSALRFNSRKSCMFVKIKMMSPYITIVVTRKFSKNIRESFYCYIFRCLALVNVWWSEMTFICFALHDKSYCLSKNSHLFLYVNIWLYRINIAVICFFITYNTLPAYIYLFWWMSCPINS